MTEGYDRLEGFLEAEISLDGMGFAFPLRKREGPKPGSSAAVVRGLVRLRELALERAARLHRHALCSLR